MYKRRRLKLKTLTVISWNRRTNPSQRSVCSLTPPSTSLPNHYLIKPPPVHTISYTTLPQTLELKTSISSILCKGRLEKKKLSFRLNGNLHKSLLIANGFRAKNKINNLLEITWAFWIIFFIKRTIFLINILLKSCNFWNMLVITPNKLPPSWNGDINRNCNSLC